MCQNTPVSNTVKQYIQGCLERAFPIWLRENAVAPKSPRVAGEVSDTGHVEGAGSASGTVLAKRAEHLVNAIYVLTGALPNHFLTHFFAFPNKLVFVVLYNRYH